MVALAADYGEWNCGEGACGKLFQDKTSGRCFALVTHSPELRAIFERIPEKKLKELFPNYKFSSVKETQLVFDMKEFLKVKMPHLPLVNVKNAVSKNWLIRQQL